jgi:hypothetical protein
MVKSVYPSVLATIQPEMKLAVQQRAKELQMSEASIVKIALSLYLKK